LYGKKHSPQATLGGVKFVKDAVHCCVVGMNALVPSFAAILGGGVRPTVNCDRAEPSADKPKETLSAAAAKRSSNKDALRLHLTPACACAFL